MPTGRATLAGAAICAVLTVPAAAQPALPGVDGAFLGAGPGAARTLPVLPGSSRIGAPFGALDPGEVGVPEPGWRVTPSIGLQLLGTDNARGSARDKQADLITTVTPAVVATANTVRVSGLLSYSPSARIAAESPEQNRIDQRFSGQAFVTVVPETLFVDLRAFGAVSPIAGGSAPQSAGAGQRGFGLDQQTNVALQSAAVTDRRSVAQTSSVSVSPYIFQRFGGLGIAQVGYSYQLVNVSGDTTRLAGSAQPFFTATETTTQQGYAVLRTGEEFGRAALESRTVGTVFQSDGVLDGAQRIITTVQGRYAITREIAVLAEGGYESQSFGGTQPLSIEGPVWSVGARLTPDPGSSITVKYGRRDGFDSASLDAGFDVGVRTRIFASYAEQLSTVSQQTIDLLSNTSIDALGNPVDTTTGAPITAPFGGGFLASQNSLFRIRRATLSAAQSWERDVFILSLFRDDRRPITSAVGTTAFAQKGTSINLTWSHELDPETAVSTFAQYGRTESASAGNGDVYVFGATLARSFSPTLTGSLQYIFSRRDGGGTLAGRAFADTGGGAVTQNIFIAALRKTF